MERFAVRALAWASGARSPQMRGVRGGVPAVGGGAMVTVLDPPAVEPHAEGMPSLVTPPLDNAHKLGDSSPNHLDALIGTISHSKVLCTGGSWFQERCCHGSWCWRFSPCDKWSCEACRRRRVETELIPEILEAPKKTRRRRVSLKHVVLTWRGDDLGAQPTAAGAKRPGVGLGPLGPMAPAGPEELFRVPEGSRNTYIR